MQGELLPCLHFQSWSPSSVHFLHVQAWRFSDNNPPRENSPPPPPQVAALLALSAQGIYLQRACFNTPYCLSLSRLIGSFNTSVVLPAVVIIQRSWLSANSSTELAVQLPVYYSKTSAEQSGDSHMPIWLWTACEVPCGTLRVKQGSNQFF